jgi:hypothetical protein
VLLRVGAHNVRETTEVTVIIRTVRSSLTLSSKNIIT